MRRVFGMPAGPLAVALAVLLIAALGTIALVALRRRVFFKLGLRNIPRRRARSALIVLGLMLGTTIIASALFTGDTMASAVRATVLESLGVTDETVTAGTDAHIDSDPDLAPAKPYFDAAGAVAAVTRATRSLPVDAVTPAIIEPVAAQNRVRGQTEPRVVLFATDPSHAASLGLADLATLRAGEVLLTDEAATKLNAAVGDNITFLAGTRTVQLRVARSADYRGTSTSEAAAIVPLATAQQMLGQAGRANFVLVSNKGGDTSGVRYTTDVERAIDAAVRPLGLDAQPVKRDGLDVADTTGDSFVQLFTTFGSFSMAAGVLLIFLIFVMLATERRPEMGMARAVGTQRAQLVESFLFEGATYDVAAAMVGAALGIGVSYAMVGAVKNAFTTSGLNFAYRMTGRSLLIAYALGVLLTLVVVTVSAWRVSRLNIVSAIRDIPEQEYVGRRRGRWLLVGSGIAVGTLMAVSGATSQIYLPWMLGVSLVILSIVPIVRLLGRSERFAYTTSALALLVLWLLPLSVFDSLFGKMSKDFTIWIASGLIIVIAATWLITYNADVLLGLAWRAASPFRSLRPIVRMAVAYPLKSRFRTGVTMSMFMLVVFTLVTGSTIPTAFINSFNDVKRFGGGYDVRVTTSPAAATSDLRSELPAAIRGDITATGAQSLVPIEARQSNADRGFARYVVRGLDDAFVAHTTYGFSAMATGYRSAHDVWAAVRGGTQFAVVDSFVAPRHDRWGVGVMPDFQLSGFFLEDGSFAPVPVTIQDPLTGGRQSVTVIGVLSDAVPLPMAGITVSQKALAPFGVRATPTVHHFALRAGTDPAATARRIETALLARGAQAETYRDLLNDAVGGSLTFVRIIQGFMGLGLFVGVAALGVVSARAVVERRQQLGMLRAIGFQPKMIRRTLMAETAIVAGTAIVVGAGLGLLVSFNVVRDAQGQPGYSAMHFAVPVLYLLVIFATVIVAALLTTLASALRATRLYPAEALRYQ